MQVQKQQLELDMEKQIGSKLGKHCVKVVRGNILLETTLIYTTLSSIDVCWKPVMCWKQP